MPNLLWESLPSQPIPNLLMLPPTSLEMKSPPTPVDNAVGQDPPFDMVDESVMDAAMGADDVDASDHPDAVQFGMDVDMLMSLGVEPADATRFVHKCMRSTNAITFIEAYGRGGLSEEARKSSFNINGLRALDF